MRCLFGPVGNPFLKQYLGESTRRERIIPFGPDHFPIGPTDTWETIRVRLGGKEPDCVIVNLGYTSVPDCVWTLPVPVIVLAPDWHLLWHQYRHCLPFAELAITDPAGVEAFRLAGFNAEPGELSAADRPTSRDPGAERDIDVVWVGNLNPAIQRDRAWVLQQLGRMSDRCRVVVRASRDQELFRDLCRRGKIVVESGGPGERRRQAWEASSAGSLYLAVGDGRLLPSPLGDIAFTEETLEGIIWRYLRHEEERRRLVREASASLPPVTFEESLNAIIDTIIRQFPELKARAARRPAMTPLGNLRLRTAQALHQPETADPTLTRDLLIAARDRSHASFCQNALGTLRHRGGGPNPSRNHQALDDFRQAVSAGPGDLLACLNLSEALALTGNPVPAVDEARRGLALIGGASLGRPVLIGDGTRFPPAYDWFRIEWERAGWEHAGDPAGERKARTELIRWRLHSLIAEHTGDLTHAYEAVTARPDLPVTRSALGLALARSGHASEALNHLWVAAELNPFDREAAAAVHALIDSRGEGFKARQFARRRRLLAETIPQALSLEPWFADATRPEADLASVIIPCHNQLTYTRLCVESVLRSVNGPFELVLIDNGSTDGTLEYFESLAGRPEPVRVAVIRNEKNQGFPAACNQGLRRAAGEYLVLLNNDTITPAGWLEGLIRAVRSSPEIGLAGPVSNNAPDAQFVNVPYVDREGMEAFAAERRRDWNGRLLPTGRLTGFCLLIRREAFEKIGGLDERFGLGFFDDDDWGLRAIQAGYKLVVAQDAFVHHFGNRTFKALGLNIRERLRENFRIFGEKWGPEHTKGYHLPGPPAETPDRLDPLNPAGSATPEDKLAPPMRARASGRPRVSLSMIVRNEEHHLPECLASVRDLVDEIVVVDTGSTDGTREVAARFGARVYEFPWADSFAAARNESLRHCTGDWIFWTDADDRFSEENRDRLRRLFAGLPDEIAAYSIKVRSVVEEGRSVRMLDQVRIFPRHPDITWRYRIHEQILPAVSDLGGATRWTDIVVDHVGYADSSRRSGKLDRNLRLLLLEEAEQPREPFTLFNLGRTYLDLNRSAEALDIFRRSLDNASPSLSIVRKLYPLIAQAHARLGQHAEAMAACREGQYKFPDDAELLFQEASLHADVRDPAAAEACLVQLLRTRQGEYFDMVDAGVRGYKARHQLANAMFDQNRPAEAEAQWLAAVGEREDFLPAWQGLGDLFVSLSRWDDAERVRRRLVELMPDSADAEVFGARILLARDMPGAVRELLANAIAGHPGDVRLRIMLTHALIREGKDWPATEAALRDVLKIDPNNADARHNLNVLLNTM
ncbi:glycosyltransferase [Zavarzinella formosa]|uniref:glycosyltransferase n=1 Tax=Zavarzinella formosa TaxID=360055 RepID=UPI00030B3529|nr:glycosyltransferase [Zavarzinella formosa]